MSIIALTKTTQEPTAHKVNSYYTLAISVNVRIGEFMLGNFRTKLPAQCMLGRRGEFEMVAICNAEGCNPVSRLFIYRSVVCPVRLLT